MLDQTVSHYHILEKIGGGGMGVVYVAEDLNLDRKVAIKFLPEGDGLDEIAVERFSREARAASALNHPNICAVYDAGESGGRPFLVMELLEGCTLRRRLLDGPMPPQEIVGIAFQVASALAAAHSKRILHRDIKPANLFLTEQGQAKILDFGIAKRIGPPGRTVAGTAVETMTMLEEITSPGAAVGTVAYMSPEQARGQELDARSDLFSLGVVLYEMATGAPPFAGATSGVIFEAILNHAPERPSRRNPHFPRELEDVILKLLEKDRALRHQSAAELHSELQVLRERPASASGPRGRRTARVWIAPAAVLGVALLVYWLMRTPGAPSLAGATFAQMTSVPGRELFPALSPDGKTIVYAGAAAGNWDIYLLRVGGKNPINLTKDSPADDTEPAFSPDGEQVAFRSSRDSGGIFVMGATGESVRRVTDFGHSPSWSPDGKRIAFATEGVDDPTTRPATSRLWTVDLTTGEKKQATQTDAIQPRWSPHGDRIAYAGSQAGRRDLWTISAQGGVPVPVTQDKDVDWSPAWSPEGNYLYFASDRGGRMNLWRLPINEHSGRVLGPPEPVTTPSPYSGQISMARDGRRIAYVQQVRDALIYSVGFDPVAEKAVGSPSPLSRSTKPAFNPEPSPDGKWLAFGSLDRPEDIFLIGTDGDNVRQLTDDDYVDRFPRWSPDGDQIAFMSDRSGKYQIWTIHRDGSGLRQLTDEPDGVVAGPVWSPDGIRLAYNRSGDVPRIVDTRKSWHEQTPETLPPFPNKQYWAYLWSPDGRTVLGSSGYATRSSSTRPYRGAILYSFADRKYETVVETAEHYPVSLRDGRRVLFREGSALHIIDLQTRRRHEVMSNGPQLRFSISPDNRRLYYTIESNEADIWLMTLK